MKAIGTTLGADNGIGIAAQLALLKDKIKPQISEKEYNDLMKKRKKMGYKE